MFKSAFLKRLRFAPESREVHIWLEERWVNKLAALRGPGESYSDVIVRLAAEGARYGSINHNGA